MHDVCLWKEEVNLHSISNLPFFETQSKSKEGKSCFLSEKAAQDAISCPLLFLSSSLLKGKKGMVKLQAVYWMENVIFFTRNEKEIRELVVKVLEARVKCLDSCCTARKEYNLNILFRFFQAVWTQQSLYQKACNLLVCFGIVSDSMANHPNISGQPEIIISTLVHIVIVLYFYTLFV